MGSKAKFNILDHYDSIINQIDIQTEKLIGAASSDQEKNDLNKQRETFINKIKSTRTSTLTKLETTDDLNQVISDDTKFTFYFQNSKIGKLVEINKYISPDILRKLNAFNESWKTKIKVEILNLDTNQLRALLILSFIQSSESNETISIDFDLSKIESLFISSTSCFNSYLRCVNYKIAGSIDLTGFESLKSLHITNQLINKFDSFSSQTLKKLDLSNNQIDKLEKNAFIQFPNLTSLTLTSNKITSLNNESFNGLYYLEKLDLQENRIKKFESQVFSKLKNLKELNLGSTGLKLTDVLDSNKFEKLEIFIFKNNLIETFDQNAFVKLPKLTYLDLSRNQLTVFDCHLPNIKKLYLESNDLKTIDLRQYPTLEELNVNYNSIDNLNKLYSNENNNCGGCLKNLKILQLQKNKIKKIKRDDFRHLENLVKLNLASNLIDCIEDEAFDNLNKLKLLDLSLNKLERVENLKHLMNKIERVNLLQRELFFM